LTITLSPRPFGSGSKTTRWWVAGIESHIPGTTEHKVKDDQQDVQKDERNLGNESAKNDMSEGQKMKSDIPFTSEHKEDHQ